MAGLNSGARYGEFDKKQQQKETLLYYYMHVRIA